jgi:hypothetical protein
VIFLHEAVHALHHEIGVTDQTSLRIAHSRQADALLQFFAGNPLAAGWWFGLLQPAAAPLFEHGQSQLRSRITVSS